MTAAPKKTAKPRGKPFAKGQSGNPGGRPKNQQSITHWLNEFGNMTPVQAGALFKLLAAELKKGGDDLPIFAIVALRTLVSLMNEPTPGLIAQVLERTEGKVVQPMAVMDWREYVKQQGHDPSEVFNRLVASYAAASAQSDDGRGHSGNSGTV